MSIAKRKIGFYSLIPIDLNIEGPSERNPQIILDIINYVMTLEKPQRIYDINASKRFHLLDYSSLNNNVHKLVFKSGKYNNRPPLIDKESADERDNPKTLLEGESEKTHVILKYQDNEIILLKEERLYGIHISTILFYLYKFLWMMDNSLRYNINYSIIPKTDFYQELQQLTRVTIGEAHIERQLIGSDYLNYSHRTENVKELIQLTIKSQRGSSIKDTLIDFYNNLTTEGSIIRKIRVYGLNERGDSILLDTDIVKMIEYITTEIDTATGIVDSEGILSSLEDIIVNF